MLFPRTEKPQSQDDHSIFVHAAQAADDRAFHEMTGKKGDVILMHPLMLHSASKNGRRAISKHQNQISSEPPLTNAIRQE